METLLLPVREAGLKNGTCYSGLTRTRVPISTNDLQDLACNLVCTACGLQSLFLCYIVPWSNLDCHCFGDRDFGLALHHVLPNEITKR